MLVKLRGEIRMSIRYGLAGLVLLCGLSFAAVAKAACDRNLLVEIPVTMRGLVPLVTTQINGIDAQMIFDTGAAESLLLPGADEKFHLTRDPSRGPVQGRSSGRSLSLVIAEAAQFGFAGQTYGPAMFAEPEIGFGPGVDGLLGQNHLRDGDLEIDLAHGIVRLFAPRGCESADLAYWRGAQTASVIDIEDPTSAGWPRTFGAAKLNGVPLRIMFDTGTPQSHTTREAAYRAGVDAAAAAAKLTQGSVGVAGGAPMTNWRVRFRSFQIGDELVSNPTLTVVDKPNANSDMIIGADFFFSHRVLISKSQHRLYFTANPGNAFGVTPPRPKAVNPEP
jgi:predicted aspartyl protease